MIMYLGKHFLVELYGVDAEILKSEIDLKQIVETSLLVGKLHKVDDIYYAFKDGGVSGVVLLKESHLSFHTWSEYGYMALDIFSCGEKSEPEKAIDFIVTSLKADKVFINKEERGYIYKGGSI